MKIRPRELKATERIEILDTLYTAAGSVQGRDAMKEFLRDVLTESEQIMIGRRLLIAKRILAGKTHIEIAEELRVGYDTVGRIERWLNDQFPGFENALAGLEEELSKRKQKHLYAASAIARLKKKYPMHFLLFPSPKSKRRV